MKFNTKSILQLLFMISCSLFLAFVGFNVPGVSTSIDLKMFILAGVFIVVRLLFARYPNGAFHEGLTITDTSYEGKMLEQWIAYTATMFDTVRKGCMNILPGIKKKQSIPKIEVDSFIQAHQATPVHGGSINVERNTLEPQDFMGYLEFNPRDFEQHHLAAQMNPKLLDAVLPRTAESAIIQEVLKGNKGYFDRCVWRSERDEAAIATALLNGLKKGDNNLIFINGLQRKMFLDNDVKRHPSPEVLTSANIVAKFEWLASQFSEEVYADPNFKFLLASNNRQHYSGAVTAQPNKGADFTQSTPLFFDGKPIVLISGMSSNTIWAGKASRNIMSNLWLGVNELEEEDYLMLKRLQANSELHFIKMLTKLDTNYGLAEEMAVHMTETYLP